MANKGRIGGVPQGDWVNSKAYKMLDWVAFDGGSFLAVTPTLAGESPTTHPAKWMQTAKQGEPGSGGTGSVTWETLTGKPELYSKTEVDAKIAGVYIPKGSVANFAALPTTGNTQGHVYNTLDNGKNYVWVLNLNNTGNAGWDDLGGIVDLSTYATITQLNAKLSKPGTNGTFVIKVVDGVVTYETYTSGGTGTATVTGTHNPPTIAQLTGLGIKQGDFYKNSTTNQMALYNGNQLTEWTVTTAVWNALTTDQKNAVKNFNITA